MFSVPSYHLSPDDLKQIDQNLNPGIDVSKLRTDSDDLIWWKCKYAECEHHIWQQSPKERWWNRHCPFCLGKMICKCSSIATTHPTMFRNWVAGGNSEADAFKISYDSDKVVNWKCSAKCGHHVWTASVSETYGFHACPYCKKVKLCPCDELKEIADRRASNINCKWKSQEFCRRTLEDILKPHKFPTCKPGFLQGLELDGFCEKLAFAFEYQGEQHYTYVPGFFHETPDKFLKQLERDQRKRDLCQKQKITVLEIPGYDFNIQNPYKLQTFIVEWVVALGFIQADQVKFTKEARPSFIPSNPTPSELKFLELMELTGHPSTHSKKRPLESIVDDQQEKKQKLEVKETKSEDRLSILQEENRHLKETISRFEQANETMKKEFKSVFDFVSKVYDKFQMQG